VADQILVEIVRSPTDEIRELIGELEAVLSAEYPPEQRHGLPLEAIFTPHILFFVARLNGAAAGCGGVALFSYFAEVKRMYVRPSARGRGVAQAVLGRLEVQAHGAGLSLLRLETGVKQAAAMRLYEGAGFTRCSAFGAYAAIPPGNVATSVFFEKRLAPHPSGGTKSPEAAGDVIRRQQTDIAKGAAAEGQRREARVFVCRRVDCEHG
jgi:putative acetyltransferase